MDFLEKNLTELIKVNPDLVEKIIEHQITDMSKYKLAYSKCDDINLMQARLLLCHTTKNIIKNVFRILKIDAPEKM